MSSEALEESSGNYRYACVAELTMDDPVNDLDEGDVLIVPGKCEDGVTHTVMDRDEGDFVQVECEVLERYHADSRMSKKDIQTWAAEKARDEGGAWTDGE